jgi:tryptophan halogenase
MRQAARIYLSLSLGAHRRFPQTAQLHYVLSRRTDSPFWIDNRARESIPDSLRDGLEYWRDHCPWQEDFAHREEVFSAASYQYILYGMGFKTEPAPWLLNDRDRNLAREKQNEAAQYAKALAASLPANRDLLLKVQRYGLQKI